MTNNSINARILACFLCLLLIGAALDTLPDPPAVKPQRSQNHLASPLLHQVKVLAEHRALDGLTTGFHLQADLSSNGQSFAAQLASLEPLVFRAADASPPTIS